MGILYYFPYILKNYYDAITKCDEKSLKQYIDVLHIDLNAVIHPVCQRLYNYGPKKRFVKGFRYPNVKQVFNSICNEIKTLVNFVNPKKMVHIVIDGVAGAAKQAQQRQRRFKSVTESKDVVFDSNCITTGTQFMDDFSSYLHIYILNNFKNVRFSNQLVPGEGEHKIIRFIMSDKSTDKHCIYSPDADLIMLSLNMNNTYILRENIYDMYNCKYFLVNIDNVKNNLKNEMYWTSTDEKFSLPNALNDYILCCCMLGNDFLPKTLLEILTDGLDFIINKYSELKLTFLCKINNKTSINVSTFGKFLEILANNEELFLTKKHKLNLKFPDKILTHCIDNDKIDIVKYRKLYNETYFKGQDIEKICFEYFTGLTFVMRYYLEGIPSWTYSYNQYHAPLFYDMNQYIRKFNADVKFEITEPPKPIEQLLSVLPSKSIDLLPIEYRDIMMKSDIKHYYPTSFEVELQNCKNEHEGIPIIPFVDPKEINKEYKKVKTTSKVKNIIGKTFLYKDGNVSYL